MSAVVSVSVTSGRAAVTTTSSCPARAWVARRAGPTKPRTAWSLLASTILHLARSTYMDRRLAMAAARSREQTSQKVGTAGCSGAGGMSWRMTQKVARSRPLGVR